MENSRVCFLVLLILGIVIGAGSLIYRTDSQEAQYGYINDTIDLLDETEEGQSIEDKIEYISEAIEVYQQGPNLKNLQILTTLNTTDQIELSLVAVRSDLKDEYEKSTAATFHDYKVAILEILFIFFAFVGTVSDYQKWDIKEKHAFVGIILALLFAVIVVLLP